MAEVYYSYTRSHVGNTAHGNDHVHNDQDNGRSIFDNLTNSQALNYKGLIEKMSHISRVMTKDNGVNLGVFKQSKNDEPQIRDIIAAYYTRVGKPVPLWINCPPPDPPFEDELGITYTPPDQHGSQKHINDDNEGMFNWTNPFAASTSKSQTKKTDKIREDSEKKKQQVLDPYKQARAENGHVRSQETNNPISMFTRRNETQKFPAIIHNCPSIASISNINEYNVSDNGKNSRRVPTLRHAATFGPSKTTTTTNHNSYRHQKQWLVDKANASKPKRRESLSKVYADDFSNSQKQAFEAAIEKMTQGPITKTDKKAMGAIDKTDSNNIARDLANNSNTSLPAQNTTTTTTGDSSNDTKGKLFRKLTRTQSQLRKGTKKFANQFKHLRHHNNTGTTQEPQSEIIH